MLAELGEADSVTGNRQLAPGIEGSALKIPSNPHIDMEIWKMTPNHRVPSSAIEMNLHSYSLVKLSDPRTDR